MEEADFAHRMAIASQTCESKGGMAKTADGVVGGNLGGPAAESLGPLNAEKWYGENIKFGTSRQS